MSAFEAQTANQFQQLFGMAAERFEAGAFGDAQAALEDLLSKFPDHPQILNYLAVTTHRLGECNRAKLLLLRAVEVEPSFVDAWNNLGLLSLEDDDPEVAINAFEQACRLTAEISDPIINLAHALHAGGRYDDAIKAYRRGLEIKPDHPTAWSSFCRALLIEGHWQDASAAADRQLSIRPGHTVALALKSVAIHELGETEYWRKLVDFDRLIRRFEPAIPENYSDLATFNRALSDFCQNHPSLEYTPKNKSTELGFQTQNLAEETGSPIADLLTIVQKCAELYRTEQAISLDHPFLSQQPDSWHYNIWATVLETGGHQDSHIHRDGWLSGVYYVQTRSIDQKPPRPNTEGWIEFGRSAPYPKAEAMPVTRCYPPTEGCLYLFPSYFYHRTVPFFSDTRRISIAFDLRDRPIRRQARYIDYVDG